MWVINGSNSSLITVLLIECQDVGYCNFEHGTCTWLNTQRNDDFDWVIHHGSTSTGHTGPQSDHTTGKASGHYMYIGVKCPQTKGDRARYVSESFKMSSQRKCFQFWYSMKGSDIGTLRVYVVTGLTQTVAWQLSGPQQSTWMLARVPVYSPKKNFKFIIEGIVGNGVNGDIAIDDMAVNTMNCGVSPSNARPPSATTTAATTLKPTSTTPRKSTAHVPPCRGFYLYTEVNGQSVNKTARLQSKSITSRTMTKCFSFWYHMHGDHIGTLNLYIMSTPTIGSPVWTKTGAQGLNWKQGAITVTKRNTPYKILIEAVTANGNRGDIAIDDVKLANGTCTGTTGPPVHTTVHPGQVVRKCDFEAKAICGYTQDKTDKFDWTWTSHTTSSYGTGPSNDHTYGTTSGHYLYTEATNRANGDIARILSPTYHDSQAMCVNFYYHMYGSMMGTFNVYAQVGNNTGRPLFSRRGNQGNKWTVGQATVPASTATSGYRMVFEGSRGSGYKSDIALDDVSFKVGSCSNPGDCTFESGLCTWKNTAKGDQFDWTMDSAGTSTTSTGPSTDHTLGTRQGKYLYIETSAPRLTGDKAWLVSESFPRVTSSGRCVSFWYSMYGATVDSLNIYIRVPGRTDYMIWHQSGNQGNGWFNGQAPITEKRKSYSIVFEGVRGRSYSGDIAIDDITFTTSNCGILPPNATAAPQTTAQVTTQAVGKGAFDCDFQNDFCGWVQSSKADQFDWTRHRGSTGSAGTGPTSDHSLGNSNGYYIYIETSGSMKTGDKAQLFSPRVQAGQSCITFWYNMYGSNVGALNVYVQTGAAIPSTPTWKRTGTHGTHWRMGQFSVNVKTPFNMVLEGVRGNGYRGDIAIDDVNIANGSCSAGTTVGPSSKPAADKCNFEASNLCGFSQDHSDKFDWSRTTGSTSSRGTGPSSDHTYGTRLGHYMYIETSSPRRPNDVARLNSFILTGPTSPTCFTFWYHMYGSSIGSLNVYVMRNGARGSPVWHMSGKT
ncbi:MAM and LDL-receptor class A domain-containing protein 1-like [Haliotis rubra]|uniref:MAM and LDL-receptor class A domain-containing protein 1-like n=1 Tax=Haliotis rubra TaxID=36100 RepID=UPI001EE5F681|nr:MAM and LDL-receptor class A domain-containing protein 1-like [Haliotis rubra]